MGYKPLIIALIMALLFALWWFRGSFLHDENHWLHNPAVLFLSLHASNLVGGLGVALSGYFVYRFTKHTHHSSWVFSAWFLAILAFLLACGVEIWGLYVGAPFDIIDASTSALSAFLGAYISFGALTPRQNNL